MPGPDAPVKPAPRTERIAVVVRDVAAGVEFRAPEPVKSDAPQIMEESIKKGAVFGSIPLLACVMTYACTPDALLVGTALLVAGTVAGAVVGAGRVIASGKLRPPPQPPPFAGSEIEASTSAIERGTGESLGTRALRECLLRNLSSTANRAPPIQWTHEKRTAIVAAADVPLPIGASQAVSYAIFRELGYDYAIEGIVPGVAIVPDGNLDQTGAAVPARVLVEGGLRFHDVAREQAEERKLYWRGEPRTLREWRADDGILFAEVLRQACDSLGAQISSAAEGLWTRAGSF